MAFDVTVASSASSNSISVGGSKAYSGSGRIGLDTTVANAVTDQLEVISIDVSQIQAIVISSDKDVTIETNNATAPADTIALKADVPYVWTTDQYFTNNLTVDVTAFYITNASGETAAVKMECVYDTTP